MDNREKVVVIRDLYKAFGELEVLKGVDLDLYREENLVVLGRSGTGKSVLISWAPPANAVSRWFTRRCVESAS